MYADTFIPRAIRQAVHEHMISLSGNGSRLQDYLSVEDACGYLVSGAQSDFHGSLLGVYGTSYSNTDVAAIIADGAPGCKTTYAGEDNSPSSVYDNRVTRSCIGFKPEVALANGIRKLMTIASKGTPHV